MKRALGLGAVLVVATLMWPGPATGRAPLGGYSGSTQAMPVRIQIYEPTIPIPATPQIDAGVAYTRSSTDTGPVSRALASYLWPGDTVGDGFGTLVGNDAAKYPVQVNSRYPATTDAPARNTAQLTDGNGMTTSSTGPGASGSVSRTDARVTGLGVTGTNLLTGIGTGLGSLLGNPPPKDVPAPIVASDLFASLVSVGAVTSRSTVTVSNGSITSRAHAAVADVSLLSGLVDIGAVSLTSTVTSDGTKATTQASSSIGAVTLAGLPLRPVTTAAGSAVTAVPAAVGSALARLGISVQAQVTTRHVDGANGSLAVSGLRITVDTAPLRNALNLGGLLGPLATLLQKIPQLGQQVAPLLDLGPKIVLEIGSVQASATAAAAYVPGASAPQATGPAAGGETAGTAGTAGGGGVAGGGGAVVGTAPSTSAPVPGTAIAPVSVAGVQLPPLAAIPRALVLAGLVLTFGLGWLLRSSGLALLGGAADCDRGLRTGVPDLRGGGPA